MHAVTLSLRQYFRERHFRPAKVQRTFQWDRPQFAYLMQDLNKAWHSVTAPVPTVDSVPDSAEHEEEGEAVVDPYFAAADTSWWESLYFLGPIVVRRDGEEFEVFDGLQRSTTLTILLAVLRDSLATSNPGIADDLHFCIHDGRRPRLFINAGEGVLRDQVQRRGEALRSRREFQDDESERGRILRAAAFFRDEAKKYTPEELTAFAEYLLNSTYVCLMTVPSAHLAKQIFVTTNARGLSLNEADIFKSQIASVATTETGEGAILGRWSELDRRFDDKADLVEFLKCVDTLSRKRWPGAEGLTQLGDWLTAPGKTEGDLFHWLDRVEGWLEAWKGIYAVKHPAAPDPFDGNLRRLHVFEWSEWKPLALLFYEYFLSAQKAGIRPTKARNRFNVLHKRCMALTLCGASDQARQRKFLDAITVTMGGKNPMAQQLALFDDQKQNVRLAFDRGIDEEGAARMFAKWYEAMLQGEEVTSDIFRATIEHVLPFTFVPGSDWYRCFSDERVRGECVNLPGNFTCLTVADNKRAGRHPFSIKRAVYEKPEVAYESLNQVLAHDDWTPDVIRARTVEIRNWALSRLDCVEQRT